MVVTKQIIAWHSHGGKFCCHSCSPLPLPCFQPFHFPSSSYLPGSLRAYLLQLRYKGLGLGCSKESDSPQQLVGFLQIPQVWSNKHPGSQPSSQPSRWPSELDCPVVARETVQWSGGWLQCTAWLKTEARSSNKAWHKAFWGLNYCQIVHF